MKHTYFFDSLQWNAEGTYWDENGKAFPLIGKLEIIHTETEWKLDGYMEVKFGEPLNYSQVSRHKFPQKS